MKAFFESISGFFSMVGSMIVNWATSLVTGLEILFSVQTIPALITPIVPAIVGSCIWIVFGIGIVKLLLGWGNK